MVPLCYQPTQGSIVAIWKPRDVVTIDYETHPISARPEYPPIPVGVAIKDGGRKAKYYAWGHPTGNNCSWGDARAVLGAYYDSGRPLLFHHAGFDVDVGEVHMALPRVPWSQIHDTMWMLFLDDPHAKSLALKSQAEDLLDWAPEERDAVVDWLVEQQPIVGRRLNYSTKGDNAAGKYICAAPGDLVAEYAIGDVDRAFGIAELIHPRIEDRGMLEPYNRERRLLPYLLEMERQGLRVDLERLESDIARYDAQRAKIERWIRKFLGAPNLNLESGAELANALLVSGKAKESDFGLTPTGKLQTNKAALDNALQDCPELLAAHRYWVQVGTCLKTFMRPWARTAAASGGFIFTRWNSVRSTEGGRGAGARTGRLSSSPNFQNIPKQGRIKPPFRMPGFPNLPPPPRGLGQVIPPPMVRGYIIPYRKGHVLLDRDYSQQELRILAHYEHDKLLQAYIADQWSDMHEVVQGLLNRSGSVKLDRAKTKTINFGLLYGMGLGKLAIGMGVSVQEAKAIKAAHMRIFPNIKAIFQEMKRRAMANIPIRTWGGREYYCEPPVLIDGRWRTFDYRLVNVLIQGSAADCTKEALIRYMDAKPSHHKCLLTVHDQVLISAPDAERAEAMEILRSAMESVSFDVPMLSDGQYSDENWAALVAYDAKGIILNTGKGT